MESFYRGQCTVLERIAQGAPLADALADIVRLIEQAAPAIACSIVLLDDDRRRIRHGAAPTLPPAYMHWLDGLEIGPEAGSCGAAAFLGRRVIVEDIATHPNWVAYRDFALPHGLRACWSEPILAPEKDVLGTFAMYSRVVRGPTDHEIELVESATHLAAIAILRDRAVRALQDREARAVVLARELEARVKELLEAGGALRDSEERLRAVIENTPNVAIQWYDDAGRIVFCNSVSLRLFGWRDGAAIGKTLVELGFWGDDAERHFAEARAQAATGTPSPPIEFSFRCVDGTTGYLLSTVFQIPYGAGASCYVCMDVDLTERRRMEEVVKTEEALRASIYASVVDPIFCLRVEAGDGFRFLSINPAFATATGLRADQVVGVEVKAVIPEPSLPLVLAKYREAIATRREVQWEEVTRYPTGVRHGEVTVHPIYDATGRCTTLVGTVHDITKLRQAESERREIESQLHQNSRLQSLGCLASGIAHDFNNILAAIASNAELALDGDTTDAREDLLEIQKATWRATKLVRQILAFGRKQEARKERADVRAVVEEALGLLRATITGRIRIVKRFAPESFDTLIDPTQVHQVVINLVTNAIHAVGEAGEIVIGIELLDLVDNSPSDLAAGRYARVSVSDDGHGMDEATAARVFDPFFTTKPAGEGSGLGLSIVHGIMKSHDGTVTLHSRLGAGTTVELYFPMLDQPAVAPSPGRGERVMLVDDEEAIVFLGTRILTKLGYRVTGHANPNRALDDFRSDPAGFDAVISDVSMPGMSGVALLGEVRRIRPDIAVILTSGHVQPADIEAARSYGLGDPIPKPHSVDEFAWAISLLLKNRGSLPSSVTPSG